MDDFYVTRARKDGLSCYCKTCADEGTRSYRNRNLSAVTAYRKGHYQENKARVHANSRRSLLLREYGLSETEYLRMHKDQGDRCFICRTPSDKLCVDHCHATGKVRLLLCNPCNMALGILKEDSERILALADYVANECGVSVG